MATRSSRILKRLAIMAAATVVALLLAEVALRLAGIGETSEGIADNYEFDDQLGWVPFQSREVLRSSPFFEMHSVYFSADGFPTTADRVNDRADRDVPTIALIGDSFTEAYQLRYEETFAYHLDRAIPDRQVVNLGVSGYGPAQYLLSARERMAGLQVTDIVVVVFPWNDFPYVPHEVYQGMSKPRFEPGSYEAPSNTPLEELVPVVEGGAVKRAVRRLALYTVARRFVRGVLFPVETGIDAATLRIDDVNMRTGLEIVKQIQLENPDASFLVYYVPCGPELEDEALWRDNLERFGSVCDELEMPWAHPIDLFFEYGDEAGSPLVHFIPGDWHFNASGAAIVGHHLEALLTGGSDE